MQKGTTYDTFVFIEAGIKELYVIVSRNDESRINLSYPYDSSDLTNGKSIGKAIMWFGKDIEMGDSLIQIEEENKSSDIQVYAGEKETIIVEKDGNHFISHSCSELVKKALEFIKAKIEEKSKTVFKEPGGFDWKKTRVGVTARTDMTYQLKVIMNEVFRESLCDVEFVTHCLTAISGDYNCYEIIGFGISRDPVIVDLSEGHPNKLVTLVDSTFDSYEPQGDEIMVTPEKVAWTLNTFIKKRKGFNDEDPIRISLIGRGSSKCFYDGKLIGKVDVDNSLQLLPPKDPCTSIPLFFEFYAMNSKEREIISTNVKLSEELCLPAEAITSMITLSFAYSNHTLSVTYDYELNKEKKQLAMDIRPSDTFVEHIHAFTLFAVCFLINAVSLGVLSFRLTRFRRLRLLT